MSINLHERLIVALDVASETDARSLISELEGLVSFFKVGLGLFTATGPDFVRKLVFEGNQVFLDLKFLDIDETVRRAAKQAASLGVSFITVHECGNAVAAAVEGCAGTETKVLAVTVLTSLNDADLKAMGIGMTVEELVLWRAQRAIEAGAHGVVASAQEAARIRALSRDLRKEQSGSVTIVTPGIRPAGGNLNDQKRATTPAEAIRAGADYLVVGRPISRAANPREATEKILDEMREAVGV